MDLLFPYPWHSNKANLHNYETLSIILRQWRWWTSNKIWVVQWRVFCYWSAKVNYLVIQMLSLVWLFYKYRKIAKSCGFKTEKTITKHKHTTDNMKCHRPTLQWYCLQPSWLGQWHNQLMALCPHDPMKGKALTIGFCGSMASPSLCVQSYTTHTQKEMDNPWP